MNGDHDAFASLALRISDGLFAVGRRILRDADLAEDAVQQALLQVWRQLPALRDPERFEAWAYRLLVNACYRESKRQRRLTSHGHLLADQSAGGDMAGDLADRDQLERAFGRLSAEQRAVVVLHHYRSLPLTEVAAILGIPAGTAYSRLHYAYRDMRASIEADGRVASQGATA